MLLFVVTLLTGFPKAAYAHQIFTSEIGRGESYGLELNSFLINLLFSIFFALDLTVSWCFFKKSSARA